MFALVILSTIAFAIRTSHGFGYCSLTCNGAQHTMCIYPLGGPSQCSGFRGGLADGERQLILDLHNLMRQKVATGQERRGPQPPSSNMMQLKWDIEAEVIAQRWADQCQFHGHDQCRKSMSGQEMGQNIAWQWRYSTGAQASREEVIRIMMQGLYDEVATFDGSVNSYRFNSATGHYTEILWAETRVVGCGFTEQDKGQESDYKLVCNYSPAGNDPNAPIYRVGQPCSECPTGSACSSTFPGLCSY